MRDNGAIATPSLRRGRRASGLTKAEAEPASLSPQARLLGAARELFCREGIHATGIDRVLAEARVSKMTLYTSFGSKEALVRAALRAEGEEWRRYFFAAIEASPAQHRLAAIVDALEPWFVGDRFYGCVFMNAIGEHAKGEAWLRDLAAEHSGKVATFLASQAEASGYAEPLVLARRTLLLIDGAIAAYLVLGDRTVLDLTRRNLALVLEHAPRRMPAMVE